ncbi:kinase-like domain-containing protein [Rhizophagus irregularis DAOM 181602=DAOM 197198]|nr:kinase-like domain-containing protein [Rhizophagus irregularis DAOM 181602=DAOM 197198]
MENLNKKAGRDWDNGNHDIDEFIQKAQLKAKNFGQAIEWIEYDKFENVEYLAKGGFGTTFKAVWKDGPIWKYDHNQWRREGKTKVALKCLHNSQDITAEFLKEVESNILAYETSWIVRCFEPKNADNNDLLGVEYSDSLKMDFTKLDINPKDEKIKTHLTLNENILYIKKTHQI